MTRQVRHDTFTLERDYPVAGQRVFAAFADLATKRQWFAGSGEWTSVGEHTLDFRVGGREHECGRLPGGPVHCFDAVYHDIVADERIIYSYTMTIDDRPISVSMTTVEIADRAGGARLRLTEHGAYFDDDPEAPALRRHGTGELLDSLGRLLAGD